MTNNIQAKEEGKVFLDEEDPEIVGLASRFMYEQNYSVPETSKQSYTTQGINVAWNVSDDICRKIRGRIQHGITRINHGTMNEAVTLVQANGINLG
jgi:hypothetical protein